MYLYVGDMYPYVGGVNPQPRQPFIIIYSCSHQGTRALIHHLFPPRPGSACPSCVAAFGHEAMDRGLLGTGDLAMAMSESHVGFLFSFLGGVPGDWDFSKT